MKLLFRFKYIDIFSVRYNVAIFSQKEFKTLHGSILTIILFALAVYKLESLISQIINKTNYTVTEEKDILSGDEQIISTYYFTACAATTDNNTFAFFPLVNENGTEIKAEYNETFSKKMGQNCYSYNLTNLIMSAGTAQSGFYDDIKCLQGMIFEDIDKMKIDSLTFYIDETYVKRSEYYNPVHLKNYRIFDDNISKNSQTLIIYLQTIQVKYKNIYNFGFLKYESISSQNYTSYYSNILTSSYDMEEENIFQIISLLIYHSDWITTYTFSGFELDSMLSEFGGYINVCFIILKFIGEFINSYLLHKYIFSEIKKGINYDNLLSDKLKKASKINNDKNRNLKMKKYNTSVTHALNEKTIIGRINDFNHGNYQIVKIQKNSTINNQHSLINQSSIEIKDYSKMIIDANNKRLINKNFIKKPIEETDPKLNEKMIKLYKDECDMISDEISNKDELYNSLFNKEINDIEKDYIRNKITERLFKKLMDYSNLFIIFKELKLLELLVLKPDDAKFFNKYKNKSLDFNKLMVLLDNKKIQEKIFSSKLYKEYALNKCII